MKTKTIKFTDKDAKGRVINFTWHDFPIISKEELEKLRKEKPAMYQHLLDC